VKPRLLDLFCCEGGAGTGYHRAGFDVTGVDVDRARGKWYPYQFVHADALAYLAEHGHEYDAIHASPPCQRYSQATAGAPTARDAHADLLPPTLDLLGRLELPWVVENVPGAPMPTTLILCGSMFDLTATDDDGSQLRLQRHPTPHPPRQRRRMMHPATLNHCRARCIP
jgi:DNA (cytosine-5)-methyltransferase 1